MPATRTARLLKRWQTTISGAARDEPVRRRQRHQGRAASASQAALGPLPPVLVDCQKGRRNARALVSVDYEQTVGEWNRYRESSVSSGEVTPPERPGS